MRKIIMAMSVSLDGFIAGPDGEIDWHLVDDELHSHFNQNLRQMSAFLDGRRAARPGRRACSSSPGR
jgi:dihydrofolate reductase